MGLWFLVIIVAQTAKYESDIRAVFPSSSDFHGPGAPRVRSFWSQETTRRVRRVHDSNPIGRNVGREPCVHVGRTRHGCSDPL